MALQHVPAERGVAGCRTRDFRGPWGLAPVLDSVGRRARSECLRPKDTDWRRAGQQARPPGPGAGEARRGEEGDESDRLERGPAHSPPLQFFHKARAHPDPAGVLDDPEPRILRDQSPRARGRHGALQEQRGRGFGLSPANGPNAARGASRRRRRRRAPQALDRAGEVLLRRAPEDALPGRRQEFEVARERTPGGAQNDPFRRPWRGQIIHECERAKVSLEASGEESRRGPRERGRRRDDGDKVSVSNGRSLVSRSSE
jgi:hypothetical protein